MTREEMKKLLPIMQAWVDGKTIQVWTNDTWVDEEYPCFFEELSQFRIKPELKYRPFKTKEECWNEMLKHQPFGWIIRDSDKEYINIVAVSDDKSDNDLAVSIGLYSDLYLRFENLFKAYKFTDGTPFGIKVE